MFLRLERVSERKFLGISLKMSLIDNKTAELWSGFSPMINSIQNRVGEHKVSLQIYPSAAYFLEFDVKTVFTKFALVEVSKFNDTKFDQIVLSDTLYAVFLHKGEAKNFPITMNYILSKWLPESNYTLSNAPHFEVLDHRYIKEHPDSQEEIWVPIKIKN